MTDKTKTKKTVQWTGNWHAKMEILPDLTFKLHDVKKGIRDEKKEESK